MTDEELLAKIADLRRQRADTEFEITKTVVEARVAGASWASIGNALGITRQSAHSRFRRAEAVALGGD